MCIYGQEFLFIHFQNLMVISNKNLIKRKKDEYIIYSKVDCKKNKLLSDLKGKK